MTRIAQQIEEFVRARFVVQADDVAFSRTVHLWDQGYLDSMGVIELIHHLEQRFHLTFPTEVLFSDDFTTIDGIARVVARLQTESVIPSSSWSASQDVA